MNTFLIFLCIVSSVAVLNQVRTLVAHLWQNEGEPMTVTAQYLDTVNVPPPGLIAALWAPVGLRYHALHHLLPSLPYHSLGEAHRRLAVVAVVDAFHDMIEEGQRVEAGQIMARLDPIDANAQRRLADT